MATKKIQVTQSSTFTRGYKRFNQRQKLGIHAAADVIADIPLAGEANQGTLLGVDVY
jgi:hypothetical protein